MEILRFSFGWRGPAYGKAVLVVEVESGGSWQSGDIG